MPGIDKIVFFGTPEFAVPTLEALCGSGRRPRLVITQPSRPAGRGYDLTPPPVARAANGHRLVVSQPPRLTDEHFRRRLAELDPDLAVVVAYGRIFPEWLLDLPRLGCVNLHASLLPRWRGAAPIQAALAAGDEETGVTTMRMEKGLDTGPMLLQRRVAIGPDETAGELAPRLADEGADLILETLSRLEAGDLEARPQNDELATYAPRLKRQDGRVDWRHTATDLYNRWRAFTPWPGLTAALADRPVKLVQITTPNPNLPTATLDLKRPADHTPDHDASRHGDGERCPPAGTIVALTDPAIEVVCGRGSILHLTTLQRPGRRPLPAAEFARGERLNVGDRFA